MNENEQNTQSGDVLSDSKKIAKGIFPDMAINPRREYTTPDRKWNAAHFPVGTRVLAGTTPDRMQEYTVSYLMKVDVNSYVIYTREMDMSLGVPRCINIDYVHQVLKRGGGRVDIRRPLWDQPQTSKFRYAMTPRESMLQECALGGLKMNHRKVILGARDFGLPKTVVNNGVNWIELQPLLNQMTKGRGQYWTGSPKLLTEVLVERRNIEGLVDLDKLVDNLWTIGVFKAKAFQGVTYYVASKKKMRRGLDRLINKTKTKLKTVAKRYSAIDEDFQLNNPFSEDIEPLPMKNKILRQHILSTHTQHMYPEAARPFDKDKLSHYDDHDDRSHADHDRRDWDRLLKDL